MILDTFSGPRGWSIGLQAIGLHDVGIEWDRDACLTSVAAGFPVIRQDVSTLSLTHLRGNAEGFIGSPPCPTFSAAGRGAGRDLMPILLKLVDELAAGRDTRDRTRAAAYVAVLKSTGDDAKDEALAERDAAMSVLIAEPMRLITECEPEWIALEQVKEGLPVWKRIAHHLRRRGYEVWTDIVDAADYGVPQNRLRAVLLASRRPFDPPQQTHAAHPHPSLFGPTLEPWVSMADALGWPETDAMWEQRGAGMVERHGGRPDRMASRPSLTITATGGGGGGGGGGPKIKRRLSTGANTSVAGSPYEREVDRPAPTVDTKVGGRWVLRAGSQEHASVRRSDQPAPTIALGNDWGRWEWELNTHRDQREDGSTQTRAPSAPAPELTAKAGGQWRWERPATTVLADPRIAQPGHTGNPGKEWQMKDAIRVELHELAALQTFPVGYPFAGNKSSIARQIGDAVPCLLAAHLLAAVTGRIEQLHAALREAA